MSDVFDEQALHRLRNDTAIGHVRYSTTGSDTTANCQPLLFEYADGQVAIAHNGNLVNTVALRQHFEGQGHIFQTSSDTELILHLLAKGVVDTEEDALAHALEQLEGAFSLLLLFPHQMVAVRDVNGFRPLCLGQMADGAYVVASETCAFDIIDAEYVRDIAPGEILTIGPSGLSSRYFGAPDARKTSACIFELIYFADPSSSIFGRNVHVVRSAMGRRLAAECPTEADLVVPIPNCARCAAIGYANESGIPLGRGFTTSHYAGRSFILPSQSSRDLTVKMKLNVIKEAVCGRRVIVVEDSVVRGTTTRGKIGALRKAGAKEIHLRVASPPIRHPCYFGIDFPDPAELIATGRDTQQIAEFLGVDSLYYLSHEGMLECVKEGVPGFCTACFSGQYPIQLKQPVGKHSLEQPRLRVLT